ncbi:hypothetical protein [Enterobacter ludwigii]|jgi:hypothetical protein|uniref:hypothetical protein n=1 Tax=Enterobacter ludwigii TaxID=299767 RepID=UPI0013D7DA1F|nr:hypothetical protein [Enterobacter ludwigii]
MVNIIDDLRFYNSGECVVFNFYSWVELLKAIIVKYAKKTESEAEELVLSSPIVCNEVNDFMSVAIRSHESEYHWAMLIVHGDGYWMNGIELDEPDGYFDWEKEYRRTHDLKEKCFVYSN